MLSLKSIVALPFLIGVSVTVQDPLLVISSTLMSHVVLLNLAIFSSVDLNLRYAAVVLVAPSTSNFISILSFSDVFDTASADIVLGLPSAATT